MPWLCHFTPAENVRSIFEHGLASRVFLQEHSIRFLATDRMRLDECLDGVSLSIYSVNKRMFSAKKREYDGEWVILYFCPSILWTHHCRFCWVNAASQKIRNHSGFKGGPWAFKKMFEDCAVSLIDDRSFRSVQSREDFEPTNNDAEVQVRSRICPELLLGAMVRNDKRKNALEGLMKEYDLARPVFVCDELFR